jgi:hypothetical protein
MVADIVKSFEDTMKGDVHASPLAGILDISRKISEKYQDKITSGDIQLEKLMQGIQNTIPGMDKVMGGNFDISEMMKGMMGGAGGGGGLSEMMGGMGGGLGEMMGGLFNKEPKKETVIIDENFSTSNVELGKIKEGTNINIGKMLNVANSMGVIPSFKSEPENTDNSSGDASSAGPNIMELFGMMKGINQIKSKEEAAELKNKVDNFIESKLGLDMKKVSKDMEKMLGKKPESTLSQVDEETNKEIDKLMEEMD